MFAGTAAALVSQAIFMTDTTKLYSPNDLQTFQSKYNLFQQAATNNAPSHATSNCGTSGACDEGHL
jgi:hypothetical protein